MSWKIIWLLSYWWNFQQHFLPLPCVYYFAAFCAAAPDDPPKVKPGLLPYAAPPAAPFSSFPAPSYPAAPSLPDELSTPGKVYAKSLNNYLTFIPTLALVSWNIVFSSLANYWPSSVETYRYSAKSILQPTTIIVTWSPRIVRAYSTQELTFSKLYLLVIS